MTKITDLSEKVIEAGVSLWEMKDYNLIIKDKQGKTLKIEDIKINTDDKSIRIKIT